MEKWQKKGETKKQFQERTEWNTEPETNTVIIWKNKKKEKTPEWSTTTQKAKEYIKTLKKE